MQIDPGRSTLSSSTTAKSILWVCVVVAVVVPMVISLSSPLLAWREPVYIVAGFAGVLAMALLFVQPLLAGGYLAGINVMQSRRMHRWCGLGLLAAIVVHVTGLWITSPPDVIDALLFRSPTSFSVWGVIALWTVFATASLAIFRRKLRLDHALWRFVHTTLAVILVISSVVHAMQIDGTMGTISKSLLCALVIAALAWTLFDLRSWKILFRSLRG